MRRRVVILGVLSTGLLIGSAAGCPGCRDAFGQSAASPGQAPPREVAAGLNASILLMAATPFLLGGGAATLIARDSRQTQSGAGASGDGV